MREGSGLRLLEVDELVCLVGPAAAMLDRPALLGQRDGEAAFVVEGPFVRSAVPPESAGHLLALTKRVSRGARRSHRNALKVFAAMLAGDCRARVEVVRDALCLLAYDRWRAATLAEVPRSDTAAVRAAAEELAAAALEITSAAFTSTAAR